MSSHISSVALRGAPMRRNRNTVVVKSQSSGLGPISQTLLLALMLALIGLLYLTQITKTTAYGYEISRLDQEKTRLVEEQQSLNVEAARLQALERIQSSEVAQGLVEPENVRFVEAP